MRQCRRDVKHRATRLNGASCLTPSAGPSPSPITILVVPVERRGVWAGLRGSRNRDPLTGKRVIVPTVLELLADPRTDLKSQLRRHGDVPTIEQLMDVAAKQKSVLRLVSTAIRIRPDVRRLENRKRPFPRDRAAAIVGVSHNHAERSLAESWADQPRRAQARTGTARVNLHRPLHPSGHGFPQLTALALHSVVGLVVDGSRRPAGWDRNPVSFVEKRWLGEDLASDRKIALVIRASASILGNPLPHCGKRTCAVGRAERFPGKGAGQCVGVREDPTACNCVARRSQLEEE